AGGHPGTRRPAGGFLEELRATERLADERAVESHGRLRGTRRDAGRDLPQERAQLALELSHACLARVLGDHEPEDAVVDGDLVGPEPVALHLPRPEEATRDRDLLLDGVAVEADDLHAVEQRTRDGVREVRRGDEEDV